MSETTGRCPCVDGLPDPCTLCGAPADGMCGLDTAMEWKFRAEKAEGERDILATFVREYVDAEWEARIGRAVDTLEGDDFWETATAIQEIWGPKIIELIKGEQ